MKRILALSALFVFTVAMAAETAKLVDVVKNPAKYDNKVITVTGEVAKLKAKTSKAGNKYFTFDLQEKKDHLAVYGRGELGSDVKDGAKVQVTGVFAKERSSGNIVFKNEIDCSHKDGDNNGVVLVK